MNFEIYEENKPEEKGPVRLRLQRRTGGVAVVVVDKKGEVEKNGTLLQLTDNGKISRITGVDEDYGFQLDEQGRIKLWNN